MKVFQWIFNDSHLIYFAARCGQVQVSSFRVVGGELSQPGAWPWMTV